MNYNELKLVCETEWITEGPNSEGMAGIILYQGTLYFWRGDWGMSMPAIVSTISVPVFLETKANTSDPKESQIIQYLVKR